MAGGNRNHPIYSQTKGQAAIIALTRALRDSTGNLPPLPGIFPDYQAPVVANRGGIREHLHDALGHSVVAEGAARRRTGARTSCAPKASRSILARSCVEPDGGITNIRNTASPHWTRWLAPSDRGTSPERRPGAASPERRSRGLFYKMISLLT